MFRTQSAISHQIKNLERELSVRLFERRGKVIKLTWEGEILFDTVTKFFNDLERLKGIYDDAQRGKYGTLAIATASAIMTYSLPKIIEKLIKRSTKIKFKLITCNFAGEIQTMVLDGLVDLGIGVKLDQICPQRLNFLFWKSFDKVLLLSKEHPLAQKKAITLEDIVRFPHIVYRKGGIIRKHVEEVFAKNNLPLEVIMELDVAENIKKYVEMGVGIAVISSLTLTEEDKKRFVFFKVNDLFGRVDYGLYYRKDKYITIPMKYFIKSFAPRLLADLESGTRQLSIIGEKFKDSIRTLNLANPTF